MKIPILVVYLYCLLALRTGAISLDAAKSLMVAQEASDFALSQLGFFTQKAPETSIVVLGEYTEMGFAFAIQGDWKGVPFTTSYQGAFDASRHVLSFSGSGLVGLEPWETVGTAVFSGANQEFMAYEEHAQISGANQEFMAFGEHAQATPTGWYWAALGTEVLFGVAAGVIGTPATGLGVGGALVSVSGVVIAIDVIPPAPEPPPTKPEVKKIAVHNVNTGSGFIIVEDFNTIKGTAFHERVTGNGFFQDGVFETSYTVAVPDQSSTLALLLGSSLSILLGCIGSARTDHRNQNEW